MKITSHVMAQIRILDYFDESVHTLNKLFIRRGVLCRISIMYNKRSWAEFWSQCVTSEKVVPSTNGVLSGWKISIYTMRIIFNMEEA